MGVDKNEILNRIKERYDLSSDAALSRFLGISSAALANWRSRNSLDYDLILTKCEQVNFHWLLTGQGEMLCKPNDAGASVKQAEPTIIYRDNPDKDEIIQLLRDKVKLLEQNAKQSSPQLGFYAQRQSSGSPAAEDPAMIAISSPKKPQKEDKNV